MSTYGTTEHVREEKRQIFGPKESRKQKMIWYLEVVHNHFKYRHAVDDHNNRRQSPISLEETWATKWWPHRVHAFLLGVTEVNCALADDYFYGNDDKSQLQVRKEMAKELIHNRYLEQEESRNGRTTRRRAVAAHCLENLPRKKKFCGTEMVELVIPYPQHK